ncbi:Thioredoxin family protein [Cryptosporidium felis]|nr:Thioredoxin family protein [Cryptosporidium felis]
MKIYSIITNFFLILLQFCIICRSNNEVSKENDNGLIDLTEADFKEKVLSNLTDELWFIKFYAPWCSHCKHLYPEILKVSEFFTNNTKVKIAKVDCTSESKLCKKQNVTGYPTMRIFSRGKFIKQYKRPKRTHNDIIKFIQRGVEPDIIKVNSLDQINDLSNDSAEYPVFIISFSSNLQIEEHIGLLEELVKRNNFEVILAVTHVQSVKEYILEKTKNHNFSKYELCSNATPCMTIIGKDNFSPLIPIVNNLDFIIAFIQQYRFPVIASPSKMDFIEYLNSGNLVVIIGVDQNIKLVKDNQIEFIEELIKVSEKVRKELFLPIKFSESESPRGIVFAVVDFVSYSSLFREYGISYFNFKQGYEIVIADGLKYYFNRSDMMKAPVLFETIQLISKQDPKVPKLKAYSIFSLNTIKRFLYDVNTLISDIFYTSWVHAAAITIIACLMVAGFTVCFCLIFFGDLAESYLLDESIEMQKMAPKQKIIGNGQERNEVNFESEHESIESSLNGTVKLSDEDSDPVESKKER